MTKRRKGARAKGHAFEKKAVAELIKRFGKASAEGGKAFFTGNFVYHQWFQYFDKKGMGFCECDGFLELESEVILFEVKLTGGPHGKMQMEGLYKPLLEKTLSKPVRCLLVVKNFTAATPGPTFKSPEDFIKSSAAYGCWHWLG